MTVIFAGLSFVLNRTSDFPNTFHWLLVETRSLIALDVLLHAVSIVENSISKFLSLNVASTAAGKAAADSFASTLDAVRSASQIHTCSPSTNCPEPGCHSAGGAGCGSEHVSLNHSVQSQHEPTLFRHLAPFHKL